MKKYKWVAESNDGAFEDESCKWFTSKRECYNDMRNAALEKMKWNTEYDADFADIIDDGYIGYEVKFSRNKIIHESYSGVYTYEIKEIEDKKVSVELTDEQITTIIHALSSTIRINNESIANMLEVCGKTQETQEIEESINCGIMKMKQLMEYLHFSKSIYHD